MADTVGNLLVKIGADVTGLSAGGAEAEQILVSLDAKARGAVGGFNELTAAIQPTQDATAAFARSLSQLGTVGVNLGGTTDSLREVEAELKRLSAAADEAKTKTNLGQLGVDVGSTITDLEAVNTEIKNLVATAQNVKGSLNLGEFQIGVGDTTAKLTAIETELNRISALAKTPLQAQGIDLGPMLAKLEAAKAQLASLKTEASGVAGALAPAGTAGEQLADSLGKLRTVNISGAVDAASASSKKLTTDTRELANAMGDASRLGTDLGKSLVQLATGGEVSATEIFKASRNIIELRNSIQSLTGAKSAIDSVNEGIREFQAAKAAAETFGGISDSVVSLGAAMLKFSPAAIAGAAGVALFTAGLRQFQAQVDAANKKTEEWAANVAKGSAEIQSKVAGIKFDASIAGLSAFEQETQRGIKAIRDLGEASGDSAGHINAAIASFSAARLEIAFQEAAKASRESGAQITANIRKAADDGLAAFKDLEDGLKLPGLAAVESRFASLALSANFQPAITSLGSLDAAFDTTTGKMGAMVAQAATDQAAIRGEVQATSNFVASLPVGTIKITLDSTEAKAAAQKLADDFKVLAKGFSVPVAISNEDKVAALLDSLRKLGTELNFKGPIAELKNLNDALEANKRKVEETGKAAGFTEETIRKEVAKTTQLIKDRFQQEQILKIHTDPSAAKAEVDRFIAEMEHKPVVLDVHFNLAQLTAELAIVRERIITATGEQKIALQVKAEELEAKIAAEKTNIAKGATMPVDADTSKADAAVAETKAKAAQSVTFGISPVFGDAATSLDIQNTIDQLRKDLVDAIQAGDLVRAAQLRQGGLEFIRTFQPTGGITGAETKQILDIVGFNASISNLAGAFGTRLSAGFGSLGVTLAAQTQKQEETNTLLRENNDVAKANLDATRGLAGALTSGRFIQGISQGVTRNEQSRQGNPNLRIGA